MKRFAVVLVAFMGFAVSSVQAADTSGDSPKKTLREMERKTNKVLDGVDRELHEAAPKAERGANSVFDKIERAVKDLLSTLTREKPQSGK